MSTQVSNEKLSILYVLSGFRFPFVEGMHQQIFLLIRSVLELGHDVNLIFVTRQSEDVEVIERSLRGALPRLSTVTVIKIVQSYPVLLVRSIFLSKLSPNLWDIRLEKFVGKIDVVHLEGIPLSPYITRMSRFPVVMSALDAWSLRQSRLAARSGFAKKWAYVAYSYVSKWIEKSCFEKARCVHVVSPEDARYFRQEIGLRNVSVIPVAIDGLDATGRACGSAGQQVVVFWGDISVGYLRDGLAFILRHVWPNIAKKFPSAKLRALCRREPDSEIMDLAGGLKVEFKTWVDDIGVELSEATLVVLPDQSGTGLKNRTVSALASGAPVVGSSYAFEGIQVNQGVDGFLCGDASEYIRSIDMLLGSPSIRASVGACGAKMAQERYSLSSVVNSWVDLYRSVL